MPPITVIIPTRERADVLEKALATVVQQSYERLSIIVSDNQSNDATRDVVARFADPRIKYITTPSRLSMSDNYEFALGHAKPSWIAFMGDDDGLCVEAVARVARLIQASGAKAIRSRTVTFDWPGSHGHDQGSLIVPMDTGFVMRNSAEWLRKVIAGNAAYPELPMAYNGGFVHKDVFDAIHERGGRYFRSSSPDVYSAIAIASIVPEYLFSHEPFSINGTSRHSIGTSFHGRDPDKAQAAKRFFAEGNIPLHEDVPLDAAGCYPLSLHALVLEAFLQSKALRAPASVDYCEQLAIMLALERKHPADVRQWGQLFARRHNFDVVVAVRRARTLRPLLQSRMWAVKATRALNSVVLNAPGLPLQDVYQASIAASIVRADTSRLWTPARLRRTRR